MSVLIVGNSPTAEDVVKCDAECEICNDTITAYTMDTAKLIIDQSKNLKHIKSITSEYLRIISESRLVSDDKKFIETQEKLSTLVGYSGYLHIGA